MGKSIDAPENRDYGKEMRETLQAQIDLAPDLFAAESNPEYGRGANAMLDLSVMRDVLMGKDGQMGLLQLYEEQTMPSLARADAGTRRISQEADIESLEQLGPRASEAFKASNPQQKALVDELNRQAMSELGSGADLSPSLRRESQQAIRSAQADRGFGFGVGDVSSEALFTGLQAENLQRRRQQFAQNVVGVNAATQSDPFMAILGRPGIAPNAGISIGSQGQSMNPGQVFNPESAYAGSLYANNYNGQNAANIATGEANAAVTAGALSAVGSAAGGIGGGMATGAAMRACWVAREVYGSDNPRWRMFKAWLESRAPTWFHNLYMTKGEAFALWLHDHPWLKKPIRLWMDSRIETLHLEQKHV